MGYFIIALIVFLVLTSIYVTGSVIEEDKVLDENFIGVLMVVAMFSLVWPLTIVLCLFGLFIYGNYRLGLWLKKKYGL